MEFLDLKNISEQFMELANPISPEKIIKVGRILGLKPGNKVIDFGCGYGEELLLWAEKFGISGEGVDIRPYACQRALNKVAAHGLSDRIEICCGDAANYIYPAHTFDLAACIGATFIWGDFAAAVHAMNNAILPTGKLAIGEAYWLTEDVPADYRQQQGEVRTENELLQIARQEGFDFEYVIRASHDDWDNYESGNWYGLLHWIEENPDHPERQQVIDHLHESQDEYTRYARQYFGWAIYILNPIKYVTSK
jgi:SAM-dependent methyltransferase